jgi:hypothetical protein
MESVEVMAEGPPRIRRRVLSTPEKLEACIENLRDYGFRSPAQFFHAYCECPEYTKSQSIMFRDGWDRKILDTWWNIKGGRRILPCIRSYVFNHAEEGYAAELCQPAPDQHLLSASNTFKESNSLLADQSSLLTIYERLFPLVYRLVSRLTNALASESQSYRAVTMISQFIVFNKRQRNTFQCSLGFYLYAAGVPKRVITMLNHAGICVSYDTIVKNLKRAAIENLQMAQTLISGTPKGVTRVYQIQDNLNLPNRVGQQTQTDRDRFINCTTSAFGVLDREYHITKDDFQAGDPADICPQDFSTKETSQYWRDAKRAYIFSILKDVFPEEVKRLSKGQEAPSVPPIYILPLRVSERLPMPTQEIDEGSIDGNMEFLDVLHHDILKLEKEFFEDRYLFYFGDLGTVRLLNSIKHMRRNSHTAYDRYEYMIVVACLFHTRMAHLRQVYNLHWGVGKKGELGSLGEIAREFHRKRISRDAKNVYECERMLQEATAANILSLACVACGAKTLEGLQGSLKAWEDVLVAIDQVVAALDESEHPKNDGCDPANRDTVLENCISLTNDGISHGEYLRALAAGDIGAILRTLDLWTVGFHATPATGQYARELLKLSARLKHAWSPELCDMLIRHWLANPTGKSGKWVENDWVQECHNRFEKVLYGGKTYPKPSFLGRNISPNMSMLWKHITAVEALFGIRISGTHSYKDKTPDIIALVDSFLLHHVHTHMNGREATYTAIHKWEAGLENLPAAIDAFKKTLAADWVDTEEVGDKATEDNDLSKGDEVINEELLDLVFGSVDDESECL